MSHDEEVDRYKPDDDLRLALDKSEREIAELKKQLADLKANLEELRRTLNTNYTWEEAFVAAVSRRDADVDD